METEEISAPEHQPEQKGCLNCGNPVVLHGYPNPLCESCREKLIRYPVPKAIWLFGAGVLIILAFALYRLPANLNAAVHLERGKKAEKQHNFITAYREFSQVRAQLPDLTEAKTHQAVAAYFNMEVGKFVEVTRSLADKNIEDADQLSELNMMIGKIGTFMPSDSFESYFSRFPAEKDIPDSAYANFHTLYPDDFYAQFQLVNRLFTANDNVAADTLANGLMAQIPAFPALYALKAGLKRELKQFDSSLYYLRELEYMNHESSYVYAARARTYLKQKKDNDALQEVMKAKALEPQEGYVLATMALVYHYRNEAAQRDKFIAEAQKDSLSATYISYVQDIISGKIKFRD